MHEFLLTLTGPDQTGIVANLARITTDARGNWLDSRMMRMGGHFSGLVRVALPPEQAKLFHAAIRAYLEEREFQVAIHELTEPSVSEEGRPISIHVSGQDQPGIVHGIFTVFKDSGVNVEELSTGLTAAPWSGTPVFEAAARLLVPQAISLDTLQEDLEALAEDLLVEIGLSTDA